MTSAAVAGLIVPLVLAVATWLVACAKHDVSIVDSVWSVLIASAAVAYALSLPALGPRAGVIAALVALWAVRLCGYITWRNWGEPEDRRYQAIRARNEPNFALKSLYLVFGLQAVLAWIVSLPLLAALGSARAMNALDLAGLAIVVFGIAFETVGDFQLARFKSDPQNRGRVMDRGLWRYTRHPNYFGEFCVWWGFYAIALAGGGWWSIVSPLLMSWLLIRISGVALLESDLRERKPEYRDYIARTSAFFPAPRRRSAS